MARARATEQARSRSKAAQIEEIGRGIEQFQDILVSIEDFSREGFPYRDAARAKAELQLRECVRRIFGDKSPEFQTYRNHKLRTTSKGETAQSVAAVKSLIRTLEEKKLEIQGIKAPTPPAPEPLNPVVAPPMTLVPPTTQLTLPTSSTPAPPMTVSVAMTTNLGAPIGPHRDSQPATSMPQSAPASSLTTVPVADAIPIQSPPPALPAAPPLVESAAPSAPPTIMPAPSAPPTLPSAPSNPPIVQQTVPPPAPPILTAPSPSESASPADMQNTPDEVRLQKSVAIQPAEEPPFTQASVETRPRSACEELDPLDGIRKVCLRFHAVTRQLRLRKDYRTTLEVEDDYDLQDLLCALLKVEFDEVGTDEWTPPYTAGAPRTTFLIHREQIAVVAKKTRPGLTTKELADQVAADSARYATRDKCTTLFCFIYDPEGRIGSPKRLETDLTSVSDRYMIEVLVAPK